MRWITHISVVAISALLTHSAQADEPSTVRRSRKEFADAMNRVTEGMPESAVLAILGKPDEVRTENDAGGIRTSRTREIWRYGTAGHLTPATLGKVYIDEQGRAQYIYGQGESRADESFAEEELRRLLRLLAGVPSYNAGLSYNPLKVIQAVNALQPLGKNRALSVIDEHLRITSNFDDDSREGVFLVLRTLFDVPTPPGYMPEMRVGAPDPSPPEDKRLLPRFPIALEDDIPFKLVSGYSLGGEPEPPESHVEYFREHGVIRAKPLVPSSTPLKTLDALTKSNRWLFRSPSTFNPDGSDEWGRQQLYEQVLRMLDSVYRLEFIRIGPGESSELLPRGPDEVAKRQRILAEASTLKIRWDAANNDYTFLDGTRLPPRKIIHYRRETWRPDIMGLEAECAIERRNSSWVEVSLRISNAGGPVRRLSCRVFRVAKPEETLANFDHRAYLAYDVLKLTEGEEIQVELKLDNGAILSPKYQPK